MRRARPFPCTLLAAGLLAMAGWSGVATTAAHAQSYRLAQQDDDQDAAPPQGQDYGNAGGGDASSVVLRVGRLETEIRTLRGRVEELQHQNEVLQDNLRKLGQDVDFRFQDLQQGKGSAAGAPPLRMNPPAQRRGDADPGVDQAAAPALAAASPDLQQPRAPADGGYAPPRPARSGDAFDPNANPAAPGAPRPLGTTAASAPLSAADARPARQSGAPLDLMRGRAANDGTGGEAPPVVAAPPAAPSMPDTAAVASLAPGGTREEFQADLGFYKQGQYDAAATGLTSFVQKYPRDRLVPDAVYMAGESYSRLGRHREAAEQFLKLSTDYAKSPRAPDALLRLGMSLDALGAKEQACATFQEVTRKYPAASADVKSSVDRELKRSHCRAEG